QTWCEVKGPHNNRMAKPNALTRDVGAYVIICRPNGPGGLANWHGVDTTRISIVTCTVCHQSSFKTPLSPSKHLGGKRSADWTCRCCNTNGSLDPFSSIYSAATLEAMRHDPQGPAIIAAGMIRGLPAPPLP
ncbi:MAG: hypothetical protein M3440_10860, partial [Chloroflexota bacterium]|nr:hypothetical protein [Chloroflexota bacterium]